jgi:2-iminobutanoate/2-iminopropanoate deaminase
MGRPYTPGYQAGNWIIVSGQTGRIGEALVLGGFDAEFQQALSNVRQILAEHKAGLDAVAKITIYLARMREDYQRMNELYAQVFETHKPARTTIGVAALPRNALVEVEAWAYFDSLRRQPQS